MEWSYDQKSVLGYVKKTNKTIYDSTRHPLVEFL